MWEGLVGVWATARAVSSPIGSKRAVFLLVLGVCVRMCILCFCTVLAGRQQGGRGSSEGLTRVCAISMGSIDDLPVSQDGNLIRVHPLFCPGRPSTCQSMV